jgi:hypothetical protein
MVRRMDAQTLAYRAEIARRLKAARWLAGGERESAKGRVKREVYALSPDELAGRSPLPENNITASLLGSIERMERHTPPMELQAIAQALGLGADWFATSVPSQPFDLLLQALADLGLVPDPSAEAKPSDGDASDRPEEDGGADVA